MQRRRIVSITSQGSMMFSLHTDVTRLCDRVSRREWLRVGGLGLCGLSLADLLQARAVAAAPVPRESLSPLAKGLDGSLTFGRAKNVIFLWLQGGPPQH